MKPIDLWIVSHLNVFARRSWVFDQAVAFLSVNYLLKGGVLMALVWWAWFKPDAPASKLREHMIATMLSCIVALAVGRIMVITFPFRLRPLHEPGLNFLKPYGVAEDALGKLSSFPSDHAVLFFALVTGLFFVSRVLGAITLLYTVIVVVLPRMYLGLHYLSDILAGAAVGVAVSWLGNVYLPGKRSIQYINALSWNKPMYFYPVMFLVTYQVADLFENSRAIVSGLGKLIKCC